jgi:hypothetical protein
MYFHQRVVVVVVVKGVKSDVRVYYVLLYIYTYSTKRLYHNVRLLKFNLYVACSAALLTPS